MKHVYTPWQNIPNARLNILTEIPCIAAKQGEFFGYLKLQVESKGTSLIDPPGDTHNNEHRKEPFLHVEDDEKQSESKPKESLIQLMKNCGKDTCFTDSEDETTLNGRPSDNNEVVPDDLKDEVDDNSDTDDIADAEPIAMSLNRSKASFLKELRLVR
eukprot:gene13113-14461_t